MTAGPAQRLLNAHCAFVGWFVFSIAMLFTVMELFSSQVLKSSRETDVLGGLCACVLGYTLMTSPPLPARRLERLAYAVGLVGGLAYISQGLQTPELPPQGMVMFAVIVGVPAVTRFVQLARPHAL